MAEIKRPVFFSGENPAMSLYVAGTEQLSAVASYWHCTDSQWGTGHALVLWLETEDSDIGHGGIYTDNLVLAKGLVQNLTRHFPEFADVPIGTLAYIGGAVCDHTYDGVRYQVVCELPHARIEIEWNDILDRKQVLWPGFPAGQAVFDLTTVICPCRTGKIMINAKTAAGEVIVQQVPDGFLSSTAFLAFAETWIGPIEEKGKTV
jgi:hypothetical protein